MKIAITTGNPVTEEWDEMHVLELQPYGEIFAKKNPNIPPTDAFENRHAIEDYTLSFYATTTEPEGLGSIQVSAYYMLDTHWLNLIVKYEGKSLVQVSGLASDEHSALSTIFHLPNADFPIEIRVIMEEPD